MEALFNQYTAAFDALDPNAIADLYRLPCAISDADGVQVFTDKTDLVSKFSANCETMKSLGYQHAQYVLLREELLGQQQMLVNVGWRVFTESSQLEFRTLYICHLVEAGWRIFSANVYAGKFGE